MEPSVRELYGCQKKRDAITFLYSSWPRGPCSTKMGKLMAPRYVRGPHARARVRDGCSAREAREGG